MSIIERIMVAIRPPSKAPETSPPIAGGRFPILTFRAAPVNTYTPVVSGTFPSIPLPTSRWVPPSISPQMIIRTGATPYPTGNTVPPGAIRGNKP